ncbi:Solute carrier family 35 member F6 [Armadillidium vulgare]|nr:Solute carrier family 35 member F6 [Armadillidium vulgare]
MVLDSVRTLVIWLFSLAVGWQDFFYLQPIGFFVLVVGMFLYNDVIIMPFLRSRGCCSQGDDSDLIPVYIDPETISERSAKLFWSRRSYNNPVLKKNELNNIDILYVFEDYLHCAEL